MITCIIVFFSPIAKIWDATFKQAYRWCDLHHCHYFHLRLVQLLFSMNNLHALERDHFVTFHFLSFQDTICISRLLLSLCAKDVLANLYRTWYKIISAIRKDLAWGHWVTGWEWRAFPMTPLSVLAIKANHAQSPEWPYSSPDCSSPTDENLPLFETSLQRTSSHCI